MYGCQPLAALASLLLCLQAIFAVPLDSLPELPDVVAAAINANAPEQGKSDLQSDRTLYTAPFAIPPRSYHGDAIAPGAINPIYLNVTEPEVFDRAESGPLFDTTGKPKMVDILQTTNPSCGFASVLAAIVDISPDWLMSKIEYDGPVEAVSAATVTMYNLDSFEPKKITIEYPQTAVNSDIDRKTGVWWPGMYDHAGVELGLANRDGAIGPILPAGAFEAITGLHADGITITGAGDTEQVWTTAQLKTSKRTPMVLQTRGEATTLVGNHAYAILSTEGTGDDRTMQLYNPWGSIITRSLKEIVPDGAYVWFLRDYDTWTESVPSPEVSSVPPAPEPVPITQTTAEQETAQVVTAEQETAEQITTAQETMTASSRTARRRPTGTWRLTQPTSTVEVVAPQITDEPKDDGGVVWVTEVITLTVFE